MTVRLSEEQRRIGNAVRELADARIAPRAADIDASAEFPWDVAELLAAHDVLALPYPTPYGGLGADLVTIALAIEQIARVCATSSLILAVQELGSLPLLLAGSDGQKARWFPELAAGRALAAVVGADELSPAYVVPTVFNAGVVPAVAGAVEQVASRS